jgi:hypothetical protein
MSDTVAIPCAITVTIPRRVLDEYAAAVRARRTGNFVIHIRAGEPLGLTFESKVTLSDREKCDEIVLG